MVINEKVQMNILKKKLAVEPAQTGNLSNIVDLLSGLQNEWAKQYARMANAETFPATPTLTSDTFKALTERTTGTEGVTGLFYALGDKDKPCQILVELSAPLVNNVINAKFSREPSKDDALTLFDLILMQPIAETGLRELTNLGISMDGDKICGRCVGEEAITTMGLELNTRQQWLCVTSPLKTDDEALGNDIAIKIYFSGAMMQSLTTLAQSKQRPATIDPTDPWANHMRSTVLDTTQMLEVVLEDMSMSIADCTRLELGQIISLPGASHTRLNVNARSTQGVHILASSTLGVYKANKAVKLLDDIDPAFLAGIADMEQRKPHA